MFNRIISLFLIISLICPHIALPVCALEEEPLFVSHDNEIIQQINALYALRADLCFDFNANIEQIEAIDQRLTELGVERISHAELLQKLGQAASPAVDVTSTDDTRWDSYRSIVSYNGKLCEVQIITGVRAVENDTDCGLYGTASHIVKKTNFTAGAVRVFDVVVSNAVTSLVESTAEGLPYVAAALAAGKTFYDAFQAWDAEMSEGTTIESVACSYLVTMISTERYVFVKYKDTADSNQILGYSGNSVKCTITCSYPTGEVGENGYPINATVNTNDLVQSAYFEYPHQKASENFWLHKETNYADYQLDIDHMQYFMYVDCFVNISTGSAEDRFRVHLPYEGSSFYS